MIVFWILVGVNGLALATVLFFFVDGLGGGTIAPDNAVLWLAMLGLPAAALCGAFLLRSRGRARLASLALVPTALAALLFGLFVLMFIVLQPDFR